MVSSGHLMVKARRRYVGGTNVLLTGGGRSQWSTNTLVWIANPRLALDLFITNRSIASNQ